MQNNESKPKCSLCRGTGMVRQTDGLIIRCPSCKSTPDIIDATNILLNNKAINESILNINKTVSDNIHILKTEKGKEDGTNGTWKRDKGNIKTSNAERVKRNKGKNKREKR